MNNIKLYKTGILLAFIAILLSTPGCTKVDEDFIHDTNTIEQLILKPSHAGAEYRGEIHEFDKDGNEVFGTFEQQDVEGGYGLILFALSESLKNDVDLTNVFLRATVTYDEFITPSLSGKHDITGDGIIVKVTSGTGTTRQYRIRGYYE
ncbi:MAG: hypothetical protein LBR67_05475 [Dysgonamonadaceae bacterium]|jgi:hypothetical protein|nr:hypothetical protein [Dysgonamonadaceae bacterium]